MNRTEQIIQKEIQSYKICLAKESYEANLYLRRDALKANIGKMQAELNAMNYVLNDYIPEYKCPQL